MLPVSLVIVVNLVRRIREKFILDWLVMPPTPDTLQDIVAISLHHVRLPRQQFGHAAFDARYVVDQVMGHLVDALTALRQQNQVSGNIQRRERDQPNPAAFLELAYDLAHEDENRQAGYDKRGRCSRPVALRPGMQQVLPNRKTHKRDGCEHADPIEGNGRARVTM